MYPSGNSTINRYNPNGYISSIARGDTEKDIWRLEEMNPRGQINRFALGNGTVSLSIYYLHTDHLGSLYAITGDDGRIVTQNGEEAVYSFDAWGRRRNPVNWTYEGLPTGFIIDRGFTFHEHLDEFSLINMNGRVYDPVIGRFLSPDNYVQGGFTQSFNRYSYCRNNPLIYKDPDGEKWEWWNWAAIAYGLGIIPPGTIETMATTFIGEASLSGTIGLFDGGFNEANRRATNSWQISMGLFQVDEDQGNSFNQFLQVVSRHTWQQPMTLIGYEYANFCNNTGRIEIDYFHGATVVTDPGMKSAVSLGGYITINPKYGDIDYSNSTLLHEYGHFLQTRQWGGCSYIPGAILSGLSASELDWRSTKSHDEIWVEQDANARAMAYLGDRLTPFQRYNFDWHHPNQKYFDSRFIRNLIFTDLFLLYLIDLKWSD
jgi:RHS repeat-associated protein